MKADDEHFMRLALEQAALAGQAQEVPVGAVLVDEDGKVVASGFNQVLTTCDPTAHAEIVALRKAARDMHNYRLPNLRLYVTLEPCAMCLGALFHARVSEIVFGASDPKTGACGSCVDLTPDGVLNHHARVRGGVLKEACAQLLTDFFRQRRRARAELRKTADTGKPRLSD